MSSAPRRVDIKINRVAVGSAVFQIKANRLSVRFRRRFLGNSTEISIPPVPIGSSQKARNEKPDLIILDLLLPKMPGMEVCKILKNDSGTRQIPLMILTAKAEEIDRIVGLEFGADDYVTKPFSLREVVLRIRAVMRRGETEQDDERLTAGPITIDSARYEVSVSGKRINLTAIEFKLLRTLMQRRGRVQGRDRLLNDVWSYDRVIDTRTVDTHMRRLREKLGKVAHLIESVRGFGYRLKEE